MDRASTNRVLSSTDQRLLRELEALVPDLEGFPVAPLLDLYADLRDHPNAHCMLNVCLSSWIATLEDELSAGPWGHGKTAAHLHDRKRGTRNALTQLKSALSQAQVVRPDRRHLC
jgi:hypothetical protein